MAVQQEVLYSERGSDVLGTLEAVTVSRNNNIVTEGLVLHVPIKHVHYKQCFKPLTSRSSHRCIFHVHNWAPHVQVSCP